jgi:hypothetical protein
MESLKRMRLILLQIIPLLVIEFQIFLHKLQLVQHHLHLIHSIKVILHSSLNHKLSCYIIMCFFLLFCQLLKGLYAIGGLIEHSCLPNCHLFFDKKNGFNLTVRAARDIKKGEHIKTCHTSVLLGTQMRRQQLREAKYFNCECERCADPSELQTHFSTLKCIGLDDGENVSCKEGIQMPDYPLRDAEVEWICNKCPCRVPGDQVAFLTSRVGDEIESCMKNTPNPAAIETLIDKLEIFLHPQHFHIFTLKYSLVQLYGNHKDYSIESLSLNSLFRKLNLADNLLEILKRLDPHNIRLSLHTSVVLYEKFNCIVEMNKRQMEQVPYKLNEALECLQIAQTMLMNELDSVEGKRMNDKICDSIQRVEKILKIQNRMLK